LPSCGSTRSAAALAARGALALAGAHLRGDRGAGRGAVRHAGRDHLTLFLVAADLSVVQTPMFHAAPSRLAPLLPGYGPTRVMLEGAFAPSFKALRRC
jgi:hypothetical protein